MSSVGRSRGLSVLVACWLVGVAGLISLLALAEWGARAGIARLLLPTGSAQWIWAPGLEAESEPARFYLARQFDLGFKSEVAHLLVLADEEYLVYLNGNWLGSNRYTPHAPVNAYEVASLLRSGRNTLLVEVRSSRGVGGLLLALEMTGSKKELTVVSDSSWGVLWRHRRRFFKSESPFLGKLESARVWGPPPTGRWGLPCTVAPKPTIFELRQGEIPLTPTRALAGPKREPWPLLAQEKGASRRVPKWMTFDWGRSVTGHLVVPFPSGASRQGLVFYGDEPPRPEIDSADTFFMSLKGRTRWVDSQPHRFRYVTLVGSGGLKVPEVIPTDPELTAPWLPQEGMVTGVFGLESARLRTALEHEIWRELQGVPGLAGGEEP